MDVAGAQEHLKLVHSESEQRHQQVVAAHEKVRATTAGARTAQEELLHRKKQETEQMKSQLQRMMYKLVKEKETQLLVGAVRSRTPPPSCKGRIGNHVTM